ncbi:MAG: adenylosuccinate lyase [Spirochaetaceae bacterium]|jgi:adenylosuccinate lyase|nr:adenylosuccinate lyase [Spirochaetaceae bacterium]
MIVRTIFKNISPLDHRYSIFEQETYNLVAPWVSEEAAILTCIKAELALVLAHLEERGTLTPALREKLIAAGASVQPEAVYAEEAKTRHNIRALVNVLKAAVPQEVAPLVHLGATSADILDTSLSYRIKGVAHHVLIPMLRTLELRLCDLAEEHARTPQVGRTHGQHAVPITLGFAVAEYVSRLGKSILEIKARANGLCGKLSGAVGAYNATSMISPDPEKLERRYLAELGLEPSEHSTQLVEPEYLLRLLLEFNTAFGIVANLADDLRNLQRSEIGELKESFADDQVGSSTMPQKRNPWNSEHVKSLWKAFSPRVVTFFMDQISEHQRDLTNSASQRFIADYIAGFAFAVKRMTSVVESLVVDKERLLQNLRGGAGGIPGGICAESAYILLAESGASGAHETIRRVTLKAERERLTFVHALSGESAALSAIEGQLKKLMLIGETETAIDYFSKPENYRGLAAEKAIDLARKYRASVG